MEPENTGGGVASRRGNLPGVTDIFYKYFVKNVRYPCPTLLPRPLPLLLLPLPSGQSVCECSCNPMHVSPIVRGAVLVRARACEPVAKRSL